MTEIPFVYLLFAIMIVLFIVIALIFRWLDRRRDMQRLHALMFILEFEKQQRDKLRGKS